MLLPPFLKKGDLIGIAATARKISADEMQLAIKNIEFQGFRVLLSNNLYAQDNQFAGNDKQRLSDIQQLIDHKEVKAILIARGGYGNMRIVDNINWTNMKKYPKWIVGYSDVTVLHSALLTQNIASLHATMPLNFAVDKTATQSLFNVLIGKPTLFSYSYEQSENKKLFKTGKGFAPVIGGNLSLLYALQGSKTDINTKGKILFIEDLDEYLYHIDRMILSLKRAGKFDHLAGLIVGGMSDMKDNVIPFGQNAQEIISFHLKEKKYPICFDFPAGHITQNKALPLGVKAAFKVTENTVHLEY